MYYIHVNGLCLFASARQLEFVTRIATRKQKKTHRLRATTRTHPSVYAQPKRRASRNPCLLSSP